MSKSWMSALKQYFSMLNQLQIEGNVFEIEAYRKNDESLQKETGRILRRRETFQSRNARPVKCKTTIRQIQILSEDQEKVDIALQNHLWQLYHIRDCFLEQEDEQYRTITMREKDGRWYVDSDYIVGEEAQNSEEHPDAFRDNQEEIMPQSAEVVNKKGAYNRAMAKRYAELWWNQHNPHYPKFEVDCTNFVSQCVHEGGVTQEVTTQRNIGWWVKGKGNWSFSWSVAHSFMTYLLGANTKLPAKAELKTSADQLMIGDVICYDWDGSGRFQHNTIVVAKDPNGMPLVNAHTVNSRHRYWDYRDSHAWTEQTKYKFLHILV
ncbi:amidase domain-containing protein [Ammoniphilus resinae]|uniref:Putative amidase domain-containing protein n=1 Tax=Ammoniphilus resinae TaxID=861532 RepID=A0ABS4GJD1_9BACL|nr:amidase domain-containing protein [Ammoniphilus resinae]MBP1930267.1 hypothetical protein [Ammoniphilus resinae]